MYVVLYAAVYGLFTPLDIELTKMAQYPEGCKVSTWTRKWG